jgi:hypothetical protein
MAIQKEIWCNYIVDRLWKENPHLQAAYNDDQYVLAGKIVHIPQPGALPLIVKNRASFPASVVRRTDTDIVYTLEEYTTDPTHIVEADKVELSYDKISSVIGDHAGVLAQTIGDDMLIKWALGIAVGNIIRTTGTSVAVSTAGQTGNRLRMVTNDLKTAKLRMDVANVPMNDRYALIEANMLDQMLSDLTVTQNRDFSSEFDAKEGTIGRLYGFKIMQRSSTIMTNGAATTINSYGQAVTGSDNVASICWQKSAVTRALGVVDFFEDVKNPLYYGDIYSALLRMGGRRRRADDLGVIVIAQG